MHAKLLTFLWAVAAGSPLSAQPLDACVPILALFEKAPETPEQLADVFSANIAAPPPSCRVVEAQVGGAQPLCMWTFDYRATAATEALDAITTQIRGCIGDDISEARDPAVNHPDFFALHQFQSETRALSVSLKDKGALRKTLIFLRGGEADR